MSATALLVGLAWIGLAPPESQTSAAAVVTFRDGKVARGEVVAPDRRGGWPLTLLVRRDWAAKNLPDRAVAWEKAEAPIVRQARAQRLRRLADWRRDRPRPAAEGDRITAWLDRELARPADPDGVDKSPLMAVALTKAEVKSITPASRSSARMLRLGWLSSLPDVETMPRDELAQALEGRGFAPRLDAAVVSVDSLLPARPETDERWLMRRAATEVANDPGGRFLRHQGMVLPEPAPGEPPAMGQGLAAAIGSIKELLGEAPSDPMPGKLRELAGLGRVGAVVTRLDLPADLSSVAVESTLWVRLGDRWAPAIVKSGGARPDDLPADAGDGLAEDPQVKAAFGLVESLGLGAVPPELKQRSLKMGAATSLALGRARGALDADLKALELSLEPARDPAPAAGP